MQSTRRAPTGDGGVLAVSSRPIPRAARLATATEWGAITDDELLVLKANI